MVYDFFCFRFKSFCSFAAAVAHKLSKPNVSLFCIELIPHCCLCVIMAMLSVVTYFKLYLGIMK